MVMSKTIIFILLFCVPPPSQDTLEKFQHTPSQIKASAEYKAPIPDELKDRFVEVEEFETEAGVKIVLEVVPPTSELERLPGPSYRWPHGNCYMCLGNTLISRYGQSKKYLDEIGYKNWGVLYDNLNNDPRFQGVKGENEGWYYGNSGRTYQRGGILGRLFGR